MRRFFAVVGLGILTVAGFLACAGDPPPQPTSPTGASSGAPSSSSSSSASTLDTTPHGVSEHKCAMEGQGFDCNGCKTVVPPAGAGGIADPQCLKGTATCPRVCCGLCPKE